MVVEWTEDTGLEGDKDTLSLPDQILKLFGRFSVQTFLTAFHELM